MAGISIKGNGRQIKEIQIMGDQLAWAPNDDLKHPIHSKNDWFIIQEGSLVIALGTAMDWGAGEGRAKLSGLCLLVAEPEKWAVLFYN